MRIDIRPHVDSDGNIGEALVGRIIFDVVNNSGHKQVFVVNSAVPGRTPSNEQWADADAQKLALIGSLLCKLSGIGFALLARQIEGRVLSYWDAKTGEMRHEELGEWSIE